VEPAAGAAAAGEGATGALIGCTIVAANGDALDAEAAAVGGAAGEAVVAGVT
jgi:hypothetical protein